ncbi:MAG: tripartite tricarboxylate transporter TctB family protein [Lautropia sp.]|nr:tripartite tricarboxylate transporter TctB family protein [Lautropia sp.]
MNNRILGVAALLVAAFMAWHAHDLQAPVSYEPIGPRAFPLIIAAVMALCGLRLVLQGGGQAESNPPGANLRIAAFFLVLVGYALIFDGAGFIVATTLMSALVGRLFGGRWLPSVLGGLVLGVTLYFLFDRVLDVVLPAGLLEDYLP